MEKDGQIKQILAKVSKLVIFCRKSTVAAEVLSNEFKLQMITCTSWNSQLTMMRSVLRFLTETRLNKFESMEAFQLAATLDPRYKLDWCHDYDNEVQDICDLTLKYNVDPITTDTSPAEPPPMKRNKFFALANQLAAKYLAILATSAPVERLFSIAGKLFRPERCNLSDKRFEQLMMI
ncbi:putative hAT family C-terminal dimerization region-containing protein 22 [Homarus americanus]|uniref:Putative hAT family C-terminal dimerization region-containing protein 22 n=1 Tax=Homarus americanus TaxID=6706 RepID=A0A8J5N6D5_HOMAM|nr:putative hAT family C-terminal dimerization region-containing protein 22 [Homarus americanus]